MLLICLSLPALSGTRVSEDLESVLRRKRNCTVMEATVSETKFTQWDSQDRGEYRLKDFKLHRLGSLESQPSDKLVFSAFRPNPRWGQKNRGVYTTGSGLEFQLKRNQRYLFLCDSDQHCFRVEKLDHLDRILGLLNGVSISEPIVEVETEYVLYEEFDQHVSALLSKPDSKDSWAFLRENASRLLFRRTQIDMVLEELVSRNVESLEMRSFLAFWNEEREAEFQTFEASELEQARLLALRLKGEKFAYPFVRDHVRGFLAIALDDGSPAQAQAAQILSTHFRGLPAILERRDGLGAEHYRFAQAIPSFLDSEKMALRKVALGYLQHDVFRLHCPRLFSEVLQRASTSEEIGRELRRFSDRAHDYFLPPELEVDLRQKSILSDSKREFRLASRLLYVQREYRDTTFSQIEEQLARRLRSSGALERGNPTVFLSLCRLEQNQARRALLKRRIHTFHNAGSSRDRQAACHARVAFQDWVFIPKLAEHLDSEDPALQLAAIHSIERLSRLKPGAEPLPSLRLADYRLQPFVTADSRRKDAAKTIKKWIRKHF